MRQCYKLSAMKEKKAKEELQTRRDFFRNAAKAALPILGAVVLTGVPTIVKASEKTSLGCNWACEGACTGNCYGSCTMSCSGCYGSCTGTCSGTCSGSCQGNCSYYCSYSSRMGG